jgi:hypothetical protein
MILKIFSPKKFSKKIGVFNSKRRQTLKKIDHNVGIWEKRHFFAENWENSQKIVIITSTLGNGEKKFPIKKSRRISLAYSSMKFNTQVWNFVPKAG